MKLKIKEKVRLGDLEPGSLFLSEDKKTLGLKSEYRVNGAVEAFIVGSGEMFWGGTSEAMAQNNLEVYRVEIKNKKK